MASCRHRFDFESKRSPGRPAGTAHQSELPQDWSCEASTGPPLGPVMVAAGVYCRY